MNWINTKGFFLTICGKSKCIILQALLETSIFVTSSTTSSEILWTLECTYQVYLFKGWRSSNDILGQYQLGLFWTFVLCENLMDLRNFKLLRFNKYHSQQKLSKCVQLWVLCFSVWMSEQSHNCLRQYWVSLLKSSMLICVSPVIVQLPDQLSEPLWVLL